MRLRGEVGLLRRESQELANLRMERRSATGNDSSQANYFMAADAWANVGTTTPEAALQTFLWAAKHQDTNLVENLIRWKQHDSVPEFDGLGEIMRSLIPASARWVSSLDGIRIVAQQPDDAETTRVRVEFTPAKGKAETGSFNLFGWKMNGCRFFMSSRLGKVQFNPLWKSRQHWLSMRNDPVSI